MRFARPGAIRRVAMLSLHTSPLDQPGSGDAGGMNVYVVELARRLAARGVEVEIFTRATASDLPAVARLAPGVLVRHVTAGPFEGLAKEELPAQLCAFTSGVLRAEAAHDAGWYDLVHSHYWLSGQVGWLAAERWGVPLVHSSHTLGRVKNAALAARDVPEPRARLIGEEQVVAAADRLIASTTEEAGHLVAWYGAERSRIAVVAPGVDLEVFRPGDRGPGRAALGLEEGDRLLLFVGRVQPLKDPGMLLKAAALLEERHPHWRGRLQVAVVGGPSGSGGDEPAHLRSLAERLGTGGRLHLLAPVEQGRLAALYRAADVVVVPSYNESFGLVALEAQACGTPVVAAAVGGLRIAVRDGASGVLVSRHEPAAYADAIEPLLADATERDRLAAGALRHAADFGWDATADGVIEVYRSARSDRDVRLAAG